MTRKTHSVFSPTILTLLAAALLVAPALASTTGHDPARDHEHAKGSIEAVLHHYEMVRARLADDSLEGVGDHAAAIERTLTALTTDFDAEAAAVRQDAADQARKLLVELENKAEALATTAADLESTRNAFYELSKPLVRYRELMTGEEKPLVVYCSMAKRSWLQADEEIGNPYHGNSMKQCGAVVSR